MKRIISCVLFVCSVAVVNSTVASYDETSAVSIAGVSGNDSRRLVKSKSSTRLLKGESGGSKSGACGSNPSSAQECGMTKLIWDNKNTAKIELCQVGHTFGYRLPGMSYCGPAGLVVRMKPGVSYKLILENTSTEPANIHTHGLHISGVGNGDDITREVEPGKCILYNWPIRKNHMGGTFWIHDHRHMLSYEHVRNGAFMLGIIENGKDVLKNVRSKKEREDIQKWMNNELLMVVSETYDTLNYVVNRQDHFTFELVRNEWYYVRMLAMRAFGGRVNVTFPEDACQVHVVAWDAVYRFDVPRQQNTPFLSPAGSGRTDLAIRCQITGQHTVSFQHYSGANSELRHDIVTLNVAPGATTSATPFLQDGRSWKSPRPPYLRDLTNVPSSAFVKKYFYMQILFDPNLPLELNERFRIVVSDSQLEHATTDMGYKWDPDVPAGTIKYNTLQEWNLNNTSIHPFHLHIYHVQTFGCDGHENGQYYDTIIAQNNDCKVRFPVIDYGGRAVLHCHKLDHEDLNMMIWFNVQGGFLQGGNPNEFSCPQPKKKGGKKKLRKQERNGPKK